MIQNRIKNTIKHLFALSVIALMSSCSDNDSDVVTTFKIEGNPESIEISDDAIGLKTDGYLDRGTALRYVFRTNASWRVEIDDAESNSWLKIFPSEGKGDALFFVAADQNSMYDPRETNIRLIIDGQDEDIVIPVTQSGAAPKLQASQRVTVRSDGGQSTISVIANLEWTAEMVEEEGSDWLQITDITSSTIVLNATAREEDAPRTAHIALLCPPVPEKNDTITVVQYGPSIILYEDFEWLTGYPMVNSGQVNMWYDSKSAVRIDSWTDGELSNGWSCWTGTAVVDGTSSSNPTVYGGAIDNNGWAKLGRTSVNGNLASPRFATIGEKNKLDVKVSFVACPYVAPGSTSKSGAFDMNYLYVFVYGGGTIEDPNSEVNITNIAYVYNGDWETPFYASDYPDEASAATAKKAWRKASPKSDMNGTFPAKLFILENYPNSKFKDLQYYPYPLDCEEAKHELIIRGATENTQVVFQAGDWNDAWSGLANEEFTIVGKSGKTYTVQRAKKCNRVFIDNVVVRNLDAAN
jgi:hypothetical protein